MIGIVPIVTTAANALYAQSYIQLDSVKDVNAFETLNGGVLKTLIAKDAEGNILNIDRNEMQNGGLLAGDLVGLIASDSWFSEVTEITVKLLEVNESKQNDISNALTAALSAHPADISSEIAVGNCINIVAAKTGIAVKDL